MTRMTGPDCVVMCNLINTYIHTYIHYLELLNNNPLDYTVLSSTDVSHSGYEYDCSFFRATRTWYSYAKKTEPERSCVSSWILYRLSSTGPTTVKRLPSAVRHRSGSNAKTDDIYQGTGYLILSIGNSWKIIGTCIKYLPPLSIPWIYMWTPSWKAGGIP